MRTYLNLMITMVLGGLWHGAALSYAVWGGFHGSALAIERFLSDRIKMRVSRIFLILKGVMVFLVVTLGWLLFKLPEFKYVILFLVSLRKNFWLLDKYKIIAYVILYSLPIILYHLAYLLKKQFKVTSSAKWKYVFYAL